MYNTLHADEMPMMKKRIHYFLAIFGIVCGTISGLISMAEIVKAFQADGEGQIAV